MSIDRHSYLPRITAATLTITVTFVWMPSSLAYSTSAEEASNVADMTRTNTQRIAAQQAIMVLASEATGAADADGDPEVEPLTMKTPPSGVPAPAGGGLIPDGSGAPKDDSYKFKLGYCAWDNGSVNTSAGRITGAVSAFSAPVLAVIAPGVNNMFETSCADVSSGVGAKGDDYVVKYAATELRSKTGSIYYGDPVPDKATLDILPAADLRDGEVRLVKSTNVFWRWDKVNSLWLQVNNTPAPPWLSGVTAGARTTYYSNDPIGIGTDNAPNQLTVVDPGTGVPIGARTQGQYNGLQLFNPTTGTSGLIGYDNTANAVLLDAQNAGGQINLNIGGATYLNIANTGLVTAANGLTVNNAALTANAGIATTTLATSGLATLNSLSTANAAITGGSINGTAIGNVTPSTGAFTNLSATGTITSVGGFIGDGSGLTGFTSMQVTDALGYVPLTSTGNAVLSGKLAITGGDPVALALGAYYLRTGLETGANIVMDNAVIQARNNGAASVLALNPLGGNVTAPRLLVGSTVDDGTGYNLQVTGGIKAASGGLSVAGGNLVLGSANVTGTFAARPAAGVADRIYIASDTNEIYRDTGSAWVKIATGSTSLSSLTAAVAANTINNAAFAQNWNWQLTGNTTAFNIGENAASTGGTGTQYLMNVGTLAASTAIPFRVATRGTEAFRVDSANPQLVANAGTVGAPSYSFSGSQNTGFYSPAANQVAASVSGTRAMWLTGGSVGLGLGSLAADTSGNATAVGTSTLASNTGYNSVALGYEAAKANTTGNNNTAVGYQALLSNTSADNNTALGFRALRLNTTGINNTASGLAALENNTVGDNNTATGMFSLLANTTGAYNTANGFQALRNNTIGTNNTAYGNAAGYTPTGSISSSHSTFVGANATIADTAAMAASGRITLLGADATASGLSGIVSDAYMTAIGSGSSVTTVNTVVLGRTTDKTVIGATGTDGSAFHLQVTGGIKAATGGLQVAGGELVLNSPAIIGLLSARPAAGTAGRLYLASDTNQLYRDDGTAWNTLAAGNVALSSLTAATAANTINNAAFAQNWNWQLTGNTTGFNIGENAASTGGTGTQYLMNIGTLAASTAIPFRVATRGVETFRVDSANPQVVFNAGTVTAPSIAFAGSQNTGLFLLDAGQLAASSSGARSLFLGTTNVSVGRNSGIANLTGANNTQIGVSADLASSALNYATSIGSGAIVGTSNTVVLGRTTDVTVLGATADNLSGNRLQVTGGIQGTGNLTIGGTGSFTGGVTASAFSGDGAALTNLNAGNIASGTLAVARGGTGINASTASNGSLLIGNGSGYTLGTLTAGSGIGITNGAGSISIANTGVISFNTRTGAVTLTRTDVDGVVTLAASSSASASAGANEVNLALGNNALGGGVARAGNLAIGQDALSSMTSGVTFATSSEGTRNTALGYQALKANTTGNFNTATGAYALTANTTGYRNVASGANALEANTTGYHNAGLGASALRANTTGYQNTASGAYALDTNTSGYQNTATGSFALRDTTTGYDNTAAGAFALRYNTIGFRNVASGSSALFFNTSGERNVASGVNALYSNTTGYRNVASGDDALYANTTGYQNSAFGSDALSANTTGIGNAATGYDALRRNTTGNYNTALGYYAGRTATLSTTGSNSTFIGASSGPADTAAMAASGRITLLGANATASGLGASVADAYMTAVGSGASVTSVNTVVLGRTTDVTVLGATSAASSGNLLNARLQVSGNIATTGNITSNAAQVRGSAAIAEQGLYLQWNRDGGGGSSYFINQKGLGGGGFRFGESTTGDVFTQTMSLDANGALTTTGKGTFAGVDVPSGNLVLSSSSISGTLAARPAFGVANRIYIATDTNEIYRDTGTAWNRIAAGSTSLSSLTAATANNTINNAAFAQNWNWQLASDTTGINISENAASTGGTGTQYLARIGTLATSTAIPLSVASRGVEAFRVDSVNPQIVANAGTAAAPSYAFNGSQNTGFYLPSTGQLAASVTGTRSMFLSSAGIAIGLNALAADNTGTNYNTAVGNNALASTTTGASNVGVGHFTMASNTAGAYNTSIGEGALFNNTTGNDNVALGRRAGHADSVNISTNANTTGSNNTFLGAYARPGTTTQLTYATAIGSDALVSSANTIALGRTIDKTVIGATATDGSAYTLQVTGGIKAATGGMSVAGGDLVLGSTSISGTLAARPAFGVANRIYIATDTNEVYRDTGSAWNRIARGAATTALSDVTAATANNTISNAAFAQAWNWQLTGNTTGFNIGEFAASTGGTGTQYLMNIGTLAASTAVPFRVATRGTEAFRVDSTNPQLVANSGTAAAPSYTFNGSQSTGFYSPAANVLGASINGTAALRVTQSGSVALGGGSLSADTSANATALGTGALRVNTIGSDNTAVGFQALYANTEGVSNTAIGSQVLYSNTTGEYNTGTGAGALYSNTAGYDNSAFGEGVLYYNTTGHANSAVGSYALRNNTTGYRNAAVGAYSLEKNTTGESNSAFGYHALNNNTIGFYNVAIGNASLYDNISGIDNTAVGFYASIRNTTGSGNTSLGADALGRNTTGSYNVAIGNNAYNLGGGAPVNTTTGSNSVMIGSNATTPDNAIMAATGRITLLGAGATASGLGAAVADAYMTAIGSGALVTSVNTVVLGRTTDKTVIGATATDGSAFNLQVTGGIKAATGGVSVAGGDLVLGSTNISGTIAARPAAGTANRIYIATDTNEIYRDTGSAWNKIASGSGAAAALSSITAATAGNTLANGAFAQAWNWQLTGNTTAYSIGESAASTGGTGTQYLMNIGTLAASTAIPFRVATRGTEAFRVDSTNPQLVANAGTLTAPSYSFAGSQSTGIYSPAANELGASVGGTQALRLTADRTALGIGASVTTANTVVLGRTTDVTVLGATADNLSGNRLQVTGGIQGTGNLTIGGTGSFTSGVTASAFTGDGAALTNLNAGNIASGTLSIARGGTGLNGSTATNGSLLIGNGAGYTLGTLTAGSGIGITNSAGSITIANNGVTSFNTRTGAVTLTKTDVDGVVTLAASASAGTGQANLALGTNALGGGVARAGNVAIGQNALAGMTASVVFSTSNEGTQNTALGYTALQANTTGQQNVAVGYQALRNNTTGLNNLAFGANALLSNTSGSTNNAFGGSALESNTTGASNTAVGHLALNANSTGNNNVATGRGSLRYGTAGSNNVATGYNALERNAGNNNTALGYQAGSTANNISASNLTFIGSGAGIADTGIMAASGRITLLGADATASGLGASVANAYMTAVGSGASVTTANTVVLGRTTDVTVLGATADNLSGNRLQVTGGIQGTGNLTIGGTGSFTSGVTASAFTGDGAALTNLNAGNIASGTLGVARGGTGVNGSTAASGTLLIGNGSGYTLGTLTAGSGIGITNAAGSITIANNGVTSFNTRTGAVTLTKTDVDNVVRFAASSGALGGEVNLALGTNALGGGVARAGNVAIGQDALSSMTGAVTFADATDGTQNTAVGHSALKANTIGEANSALGYQALTANTQGFLNSAFGFSALAANTAGNYNQAFGTYSLFNNTTGSTNVAMGHLSMNANTSGSQNVGIGNGVMRDSTTGNNNVGIGFEALHKNAASSNNSALGHRAGATVNNNLSGNNSIFLGAGTTIADTAAMAASGRITLLGSDATASGLGAAVANAYMTAIGSGSSVTSVNTVVLGRTTDRTVIGATGTDGSAFNLQVTGGIKALTGGVSVAGGDLVLGSANISGTLASRPAAGVANRIYIATDTNEIYRDTGSAWNRVAAGNPAISTLSAATANNTINNAAFAQTWNWQLTANTTAFNVSENVASTGGSGTQYLFNVGTLAASTAIPFRVATRGTEAFRVDSVNPQIVANSGTVAAPSYTFNGSQGTGIYSPAANQLGASVNGVRSMWLTTGSAAIGRGALLSDTSGTATAVGTNALAANSTGYENSALGFDAMSKNTTGFRNLATGAFSLHNNTIGTENTALGAYTLFLNTTGGYNLAVGTYALGSNTSGNFNVAVGADALYSSTTGYDNTAVGGQSLKANTTGSNNVAVGKDALFSNTTGLSNSAMGHFAGFTITNAMTGSRSAFIGANATVADTAAMAASGRITLLGANASASGLGAAVADAYMTAIGSGASVTTVNTVVLGRTSDKTVIGAAATDGSTSSLQVTGGIQAKLAASGAGLHLVNTLGGGGTYVDITSATYSGITGGMPASIRFIDDNFSNHITFRTKIPGSATSADAERMRLTTTGELLLGSGTVSAPSYSFFGSQSTGFYSPAANEMAASNSGTRSLWITSGSVAMGVGALAATPASVVDNTAIGYRALASSNSTGISNTAIGYEALTSNTSGNRNVAIGLGALRFNQTGNVNTAIGVNAMEDNTSGVQNTAVGFVALNNNTTGNNNVAIGFDAMVNNTIGAGSTAIGHQALEGNTEGNSNVAIGRNAGYADSSNIATNANITGSGNTFIGSYAMPGTTVQLNNATAIGASALVTTSNTIVLGRTSDNVAIGQTGNGSTKFFVNGTAGGTSAYQNLSDARYKKNVEQITSALGIISQLKGARYEFNHAAFPDKNFEHGRQMGFIAQQIEPFVPEIVRTDAQGYKSVQYSQVVPLLVEGIKEQQGLLKHFIKKDPSTMLLDIKTFQTNEAIVARMEAHKIKVAALEADEARIRKLKADEIDSKSLRSDVVKSGEIDAFVALGAFQPMFAPQGNGQYIVNAVADDGSVAFASVAVTSGRIVVTPLSGRGVDMVAMGNQVGLVAQNKRIKATWIRMS